MCQKGMLLPVFGGVDQNSSYLSSRCLNNIRTLCRSWPTCILAQKSPALVCTCPPKFHWGLTASLIQNNDLVRGIRPNDLKIQVYELVIQANVIY